MTPLTAAEWAEWCQREGHRYITDSLCLICADAYARQQVEAFRERAPFEAYGCWLRTWEVGNVWNYPIYWVGARCRDGCHRKEYRISAEQLADVNYAAGLWSHLEAAMFADLAIAHMRDAAAIRALKP